ncbi:MAG: hypothetical protein KC448_01490 [Yoonia sp.]|nr:hypothetical protein [Yoonia sp.]
MARSFGQKAGWGQVNMGVGVFVVVKQLLILTFLIGFLGVRVALSGAAKVLGALSLMSPNLMDVTRTQRCAAIDSAFSAIWLFGQRLANAIAPAVLGFILAWTGWQEATGAVVTQSDGALNALQVSVTLILAAIVLFAGIGLDGVYRPMAKRVFG